MTHDSRTEPPQDANPLDMRDTDPTIIDSQIETGLRAHNGSAQSFLNNFDGNLPGRYRLRLREQVGLLDELPSADEQAVALHSERFMSETFREFASAADRAIDAAAVDRGELERLRAGLDDAHTQNETSVLAEAHEAYCRFVLPVYRQLRIEGYSHYDLSS